MSKRILVTGSRDWIDRETIHDALLDAYIQWGFPKDAVLVHGAARGADTIARGIWVGQGLKDEPYPAQWRAFGKRAGRLRNELMVDLGADLCLAFPLEHSIGTLHCMKIAREAGIEVRTFAPVYRKAA